MLMIKCLVLICGPPACLKSTLVCILRSMFNEQHAQNLKSICLKKLDDISRKKIKYYFLSFDDLFFGYEKEIFENEFNWKSYRMLIADEIEKLIFNSTFQQTTNSTLKYSSIILNRLYQILKSSNQPSILFIEDNFYYSSMRHRYRQIAQRTHSGFLSIHLYSNLSIALQRNDKRDYSKRVSIRSIENIYSKYEFDDDNNNFVIDTSNRGITSEHVQNILQKIQQAYHQPEVIRNIIDDEQRRKDREINEENHIYQIDQRLRKFLSKYFKEEFKKNEKFINSNEKRIYAVNINNKRQEYLDLIRRKCLHINDDHQIEQNFQEFIEKSLS